MKAKKMHWAHDSNNTAQCGRRAWGNAPDIDRSQLPSDLRGVTCRACLRTRAAGLGALAWFRQRQRTQA